MWMVSCSSESGWVLFPVPGMLLEVLPQGQQHPWPVHVEWLSRAGLYTMSHCVPVPLDAPI